MPMSFASLGASLAKLSNQLATYMSDNVLSEGEVYIPDPVALSSTRSPALISTDLS